MRTMARGEAAAAPLAEVGVHPGPGTGTPTGTGTDTFTFTGTDTFTVSGDGAGNEATMLRPLRGWIRRLSPPRLLPAC